MLQAALQHQFERTRIVFWLDEQGELREQFEQILLLGIESHVIDKNELWLKHLILRERPRDKFLLYRMGSLPPDEENWLLDVQLAFGEFSADQTAIWLGELGLPLVEYGALVNEHKGFFGGQRRIERLKQLHDERETPRTLRMKMLAVAAGNETPRIAPILEELVTFRRRVFHRLPNWMTEATGLKLSQSVALTM